MDRSIPPKISVVSSVNIPPPKKCFLSNGIPVFSFDLSDQKIIRIEVVFRSGTAHQSRNLVADFTSRMMAEGTSSRSGVEIANEFDYYGSFFTHSVSKDFTTFSLYCLTKYARESIDVFSDILKNPIFPEKEFETKKRNALQSFKVNSDKVSVLCKREFGKRLYQNNHPYFTDIHEENFDINTNLLIQHQKNYLNFSDAVIFLSGYVQEDLIEYMDAKFGNLNVEDIEKPIVKRVMASKGGRAGVEKLDAIQSGIRIGRILSLRRSDPDYVPFVVLNTILGGYFGSRLMSNIREEKGYTYGIGSGLIRNIASTVFLISTEVNAEHTENTLNEVEKELQRLQKELVSESELDRVKNFLTGSYLKKSDGPFNICDQFKSYYLYGLNESYNTTYLSELQGVSAEKIRSIAVKYLNVDDMLQVIAGKL